MDEVATVLATLTALCLVVFAADYARARPWRNPGGRIVLTMAVAFAAVMVMVSARLWFGDFPFHEWVRRTGYGIALAAVLSVWVAYRRAQARGRAHHRA